MLITAKHLRHLPVFTESGQCLGAVADIELDAENHSVRKYLVKKSFLSGALFFIAPSQVQSITAEKMVVNDSVIRAGATADNRRAAFGVTATPAAASSIITK